MIFSALSVLISSGLKILEGLRMMGCKNLQKFLLFGMCCVTAAAFLLQRLLLSPIAFAKMACLPFGRYLKFLLAVRNSLCDSCLLSPLYECPMFQTVAYMCVCGGVVFVLIVASCGVREGGW